MDTSRLLELIELGTLSYGENKYARDMYNAVVAMDSGQVEMAYYGYQCHMENLGANANNIFPNRDLRKAMEELFYSRNSLKSFNQKE
jgi:hypothetical protein